MTKIAALTLGASKLLLRLLEIGGENESRVELMEASGINSKSQFFKAKQQLKQLGLLDDAGNVFFVVASSVPQRGVVLFAKRGEPAPPPIDMGYEPVLIEAPVVTGGWQSQAMQADLMPSDGEPRQASSNFQKRRRAQIAVLQGVFKEFFDYNLTPDKAKELLVLANDYAEDVLEACDKTKASPKKIEFPVGYIMSILKGKQQEVKPTGIDRPDAEQPDDNFYLAKPSARTAKVTARLQALGLLEDEDDDDDED